MVEALRERRTGNLARARELAAEYSKKYPHGALNEEALSLSFQAAAVLGEEEAEPLPGSTFSVTRAADLAPKRNVYWTTRADRIECAIAGS